MCVTYACLVGTVAYPFLQPFSCILSFARPYARSPILNLILSLLPRTSATLGLFGARVPVAALPSFVLLLQLHGQVSRATSRCLTLRVTYAFFLAGKTWMMMRNYTAGGAWEDMVHVGVVCPNSRRVPPFLWTKGSV